MIDNYVIFMKVTLRNSQPDPKLQLQEQPVRDVGSDIFSAARGRGGGGVIFHVHESNTVSTFRASSAATAASSAMAVGIWANFSACQNIYQRC